MPADYRSTLGFLALRERAANQERQRAEIAQKLLQDRSGMADSVRHTTNLMELAVRAAGQKQRGDQAVARLLAESEGALARPRTQFAEAPVEDMSEAAYAAGEASRLPPAMRPTDPALLAIRQSEVDARKSATQAALNRTAVEKDKDDTRLKIAQLHDRTKRLGLRLTAMLGTQSNLVSHAKLIQDEIAAIEKANSNLLGAGYDASSPEVVALHDKLTRLQEAQDNLEGYADELEAQTSQVPRASARKKREAPGGTGGGVSASGMGQEMADEASKLIGDK